MQGIVVATPVCIHGLSECDSFLADGGHDSLEDARACMELMLWKVKGDLKKTTRRVPESS